MIHIYPWPRWVTIAAFLFFYQSSMASGDSLLFERVRPAYETALDFRFDRSDEILDSLDLEPTAPAFLYVKNLSDFLQIFATENESQYDALQKLRWNRIDALEESDAGGPYRLFALAETKLHWAIMDARFGHYFRAWREAVQAYQLLQDNRARYPDFTLNQKSLAVFHSLVGIIPSGYRWGFKLLSGMEGTIQQGLMEIEEVVRWTRGKDHMFYRESIIMQVYMLMHLADEPDLAHEKLLASGLEAVNGPLDCFVFSNVALKMRRAEDALAYLDAYSDRRNGFDLPFFHFMRGLASLQMLDMVGAKKDLQQYLETTRSEHYIKEAHQKLAWAALLEGDSTGFLQQMQKVLSEGALREGGDQHAQAEAERGEMPDIRLLRVRLLFDGGQCDRAWRMLDSYSLESFDSQGQLEYLYRKGRVSHCRGNLLLAPVYYVQVIHLGADGDHYFACNSALQAGRVYEELGEYEEAKTYYRRCLELHPEEYARYMHTQAKAGLERVAKSN